MPPLSLFAFLFLFLSVRAEMVSSFKQHPVTASMVNVSSQLFPNTSSFNFSDFSYIIPYGQTQDCNIYGPICQTGSITVGVNLATATTTSVLACSSYLSAQFAWLEYEQYKLSPGVKNNSELLKDLENDGWLGDPLILPDLSDWNINFGHSPECKSYAEAMRSGEYTFSECGTSNTVTTASPGVSWDYPSEIPPGLVRLWDADQVGTCCGNCSLDIPEVRLYYFPDKNTIDCHNNGTSEYQRFNLTSSVSARYLEKRIHSLIANGSTAVISGHTFTSPSIYLQLMGTAGVHDQCTTVGPKLINPILTLPPGALTTWRPPPFGVENDDTLNFFVGDVWSNEDWLELVPNDVQYRAPLDVKDLACPTWGLGRSTAANGTIITTVGPPWLPLVQPPMNIFTLNPTWAALCTGIRSDLEMRSFDLFDPPVVLTPAQFLLPTPLPRPAPKPAPAPADPTTVLEQASPSAKAAKPASMPNDSSAPPAETGNPGKGSLTDSPAVASADPVGSASLPDGPVDSPNNEGVPPTDPPPDPKVPSTPTVPGDPPAESNIPSSSTPNPSSDDPQQLPSDPKVPIVSVPLPGENSEAQTQGLGAIIYNAFGISGPEIKGSSTGLLPQQSVFTVGVQTFTVDPTGFKVNGAAISPGGSAHTVDGTQISLGQSGALAIGSSTISLQTVLDRYPTQAYTVAGQTFTPKPPAFSIAGTTLSANGPAVTISGTIISLGQNGALKIGSNTISLSAPSDASPNKVYTVAGQTFTPNATAFFIAGTTISVGGPAATVESTVISLGPNGALAIGTSTIPLLPSQVPTSDITIDGFDINAQQSSFIVVDGVTVSAATAGVTVSGQLVSLEAGGETVNIGTKRFAVATATDGLGVQGFVGGQGMGRQLSLGLVCGVVVLWWVGL